MSSWSAADNKQRLGEATSAHSKEHKRICARKQNLTLAVTVTGRHRDDSSSTDDGDVASKHKILGRHSLVHLDSCTTDSSMNLAAAGTIECETHKTGGTVTGNCHEKIQDEQLDQSCKQSSQCCDSYQSNCTSHTYSTTTTTTLASIVDGSEPNSKTLPASKRPNGICHGGQYELAKTVSREEQNSPQNAACCNSTDDAKGEHSSHRRNGICRDKAVVKCIRESPSFNTTESTITAMKGEETGVTYVEEGLHESETPIHGSKHGESNIYCSSSSGSSFGVDHSSLKGYYDCEAYHCPSGDTANTESVKSVVESRQDCGEAKTAVSEDHKRNYRRERQLSMEDRQTKQSQKDDSPGTHDNLGTKPKMKTRARYYSTSELTAKAHAHIANTFVNLGSRGMEPFRTLSVGDNRNQNHTRNGTETYKHSELFEVLGDKPRESQNNVSSKCSEVFLHNCLDPPYYTTSAPIENASKFKASPLNNGLNGVCHRGQNEVADIQSENAHCTVPPQTSADVQQHDNDIYSETCSFERNVVDIGEIGSNLEAIETESSIIAACTGETIIARSEECHPGLSLPQKNCRTVSLVNTSLSAIGSNGNSPDGSCDESASLEARRKFSCSRSSLSLTGDESACNIQPPIDYPQAHSFTNSPVKFVSDDHECDSGVTVRSIPEDSFGLNSDEPYPEAPTAALNRPEAHIKGTPRLEHQEYDLDNDCENSPSTPLPDSHAFGDKLSCDTAGTTCAHTSVVPLRTTHHSDIAVCAGLPETHDVSCRTNPEEDQRQQATNLLVDQLLSLQNELRPKSVHDIKREIDALLAQRRYRKYVLQDLVVVYDDGEFVHIVLNNNQSKLLKFCRRIFTPEQLPYLQFSASTVTPLADPCQRFSVVERGSGMYVMRGNDQKTATVACFATCKKTRSTYLLTAAHPFMNFDSTTYEEMCRKKAIIETIQGQYYSMYNNREVQIATSALCILGLYTPKDEDVAITIDLAIFRIADDIPDHYFNKNIYDDKKVRYQISHDCSSVNEVEKRGIATDLTFGRFINDDVSFISGKYVVGKNYLIRDSSPAVFASPGDSGALVLSAIDSPQTRTTKNQTPIPVLGILRSILPPGEKLVIPDQDASSNGSDFDDSDEDDQEGNDNECQGQETINEHKNETIYDSNCDYNEHIVRGRQEPQQLQQQQLQQQQQKLQHQPQQLQQQQQPLQQQAHLQQQAQLQMQHVPIPVTEKCTYKTRYGQRFDDQRYGIREEDDGNSLIVEGAEYGTHQRYDQESEDGDGVISVQHAQTVLPQVGPPPENTTQECKKLTGNTLICSPTTGAITSLPATFEDNSPGDRKSEDVPQSGLGGWRAEVSRRNSLNDETHFAVTDSNRHKSPHHDSYKTMVPMRSAPEDKSNEIGLHLQVENSLQNSSLLLQIEQASVASNYADAQGQSDNNKTRQPLVYTSDDQDRESENEGAAASFPAHSGMRLSRERNAPLQNYAGNVYFVSPLEYCLRAASELLHLELEIS